MQSLSYNCLTLGRYSGSRLVILFGSGKTFNIETLAGIEYVGQRGNSASCKHAVMKLLQYPHRVTQARILSDNNFHAFLLTIEDAELVAVKSGFSSGYGGEGPRTFSYVIALLLSHDVDIDEYLVSRGLFERLEHSCLTKQDIKDIEKSKPLRPMKIYDYLHDKHHAQITKKTLWRHFPPVIPYTIIDPRIIDLALTFWEDPDAKLSRAYKRLEDCVRHKAQLKDSSTTLFKNAFVTDKAKLGWDDLDDDTGQTKARGQLFVNAFVAYRNPRAHKDKSEENNYAEQLDEFLLVNHLFRLEASSSLR